jgi:Bacterial aa3 type cytochrome c oxidase subunit IV
VVAQTETAFSDVEYGEHVRTYRGFVTGTMLFAAHALLILLLLYFFVA